MTPSLKNKIIFYLDRKDSLILDPGVERVEKKEGDAFSITCSTKQTGYYSSYLNWFKDNSALAIPDSDARTLYLLRLKFTSLKEEDTGAYKCNITDDRKIQEVKFILLVLGKLHQYHLVKKDEGILWIVIRL